MGRAKTRLFNCTISLGIATLALWVLQSTVRQRQSRSDMTFDPEPPARLEFQDTKKCRNDLFKFIVESGAKPPSFVGQSSLSCMQRNTEDGLYLQRDILSLFPQNDEFLPPSTNVVHAQESSQGFPGIPGNSPSTVHYVWCAKRYFRFEDYLGVLSALRVLEPGKLVFHYNSLPKVDGMYYNTWFWELKQSTHNLELRKTNRRLECGTSDSLIFGLEQITKSEGGGVYLGEKTIITHIPQEWKTRDFFSFFPDDEKYFTTGQGIFFAKRKFPIDDLANFTASILSVTKPCVTTDAFDAEHLSFDPTVRASVQSSSECIILTSRIYPKDIMESPLASHSMARWLYYGTGDKTVAAPDPEDEPLIPMIAHMFCLRNDGEDRTTIAFPFNAYLGVLSALYVAGFEHLYIHGNIRPEGPWWDKLKGENITFVPLDVFKTVYQRPVVKAQHKTDIMRSSTLLKYGGAYMDWDVVWSSPIPTSLRRYQAVVSMDWPVYPEWPESFNLGVALAKPGAPFLRHFTETFRFVAEGAWHFNALLMPYRLFEQYPHTVHIERRLQVICYNNICHPAWHKDYIRQLSDSRPTEPFDPEEIQAFHFSFPDSPDSMKSLEAIRSSDDMFSQLGRKILIKSGRQAELESV
ncbi:uncharacterized protein LOC101858985 [Aplysia californica]|uniref:Uncharacterized protein LOC101858985 n=1 Tax=Aplysia californica TaxID=6500 RepID=A0ABM1A1Q1_APLCA|nr:uncharacterized protein LOC101858985 [Aplysia californica]